MAVATIKLHQTGKSLSAELRHTNHVTVEFRPLPEWEGEFGFDWMRDEGGNSYKENILRGYKPNENREGKLSYRQLDKSEAFKKLEEEYKQIKELERNNFKYYVPYLSLYPKSIAEKSPQSSYKATLRILIHVEMEEPKYIRIFFKKEYFRINGLDGSDKQPVYIKNKSVGEKSYRKEDITIACIGEFNSPETISVYAYPKENDKEQILVGQIIVEPNSEKLRKKIDIQFVNVSIKGVNTSTSPKYKIEKETLRKKEKETLQKIFHQFLIKLNILPEKKLEIAYNDFSHLIKDNKVIADYYPLFKILNKYSKEKQITLFIFDLEAISPEDKPVGGLTDRTIKHMENESRTIFGRSVVLFNKRNNTTLAHECLHCLNLYHTFEFCKLENPNQKYIFNNSDGNIMSYEEERKSSWRWQWLLARIAIFKKFE